jgi:hypothetical protein
MRGEVAWLRMGGCAGDDGGGGDGVYRTVPKYDIRVRVHDMVCEVSTVSTVEPEQSISL